MFIAKELEGKTSFPRRGVCKELRVDSALHSRNTFDIQVHTDGGYAELAEGNDVSIIHKLFGFYEEVVFDVIPLGKCNGFQGEDYLLVQLRCGQVYLKGDNGVIYSVDADGDIEYPDSDLKIHWMSSEDILEYLCINTKGRYNLPTNSLARTYLNNLAYTCTAMCVPTRKSGETPMFVFKTGDYFEDLGLGTFCFIAYTQEVEDALEGSSGGVVFDDIDPEDEEEDGEDDDGYKVNVDNDTLSCSDID